MSRLEHIKILWGLLRKHKIHFMACIVLIFGNSIIMGGALTSILPILNSFFSTPGTEGIAEGGFFGKILYLYKQAIPDSEYRQIISLGVFFTLIFVNTAVRFLIVYVSSGFTYKMTCECRRRIYDVISTMKTSAVQQYTKGMLTQMLVSEIRSVYAVFKQILMIFTTFFNMLVLVILIVMLSWQLSMVLFLGGLLLVGVNIYMVRSIKKLGESTLFFRAELMNKVTEAIWGIKQIKLTSAETRYAKELDKTSKKSEDLGRRMIIRQGFQSFISGNFTFGIVFVLLFVWRFFPVFSTAIPGVSGLITFLILMARLGPYLSVISKEYGSLYANLPAILKINEFLSDNVRLEECGNKEPSVFLEDRICFRDVCFEYSSGKPVLHGVNLEIEKGSYLGIMGRSGEGKSTMLDLFTRINNPANGSVLIDGTNIKEFSLSYLRSRIGMVSQDFYVFNTSIRENLLLAQPSATEQELSDALNKAGLLGFVSSLNEKFDYLVGNNGEKLSEGQRQRLCMATVFLRDPEIVILDEGTSSVDKGTERHLLASLRELHHQGKTIISCSHKESALADAGYVCQLKDGKLSMLKGVTASS